MLTLSVSQCGGWHATVNGCFIFLMPLNIRSNSGNSAAKVSSRRLCAPWIWGRMSLSPKFCPRGLTRFWWGHRTLSAGSLATALLKTAAAKEYPSSLCRSLVIAALTNIKYRLQVHGYVKAAPLTAHEQDWVDQLYSNSCISIFSGTYLPDFQG